MIELKNNQEPQRVYIPRNNDLTEVEPTEFATKAYVDGEIDRVEAEIPSSDTFATKDFVEGYVYVREEIINGKIDEVEDKIPDLDGYATEEWVEDKGYLTEHQSLEGYATENYVISAITESVSGKADTTYVNSQDVLTLQSAQTYADGVVSGKQDTLIAGTGISIEDNVISATGGGGSSDRLEALDEIPDDMKLGDVISLETENNYDLVQRTKKDLPTCVFNSGDKTMTINHVALNLFKAWFSDENNSYTLFTMTDGNTIDIEHKHNGTVEHSTLVKGGSATFKWSIYSIITTATWNNNVITFSYLSGYDHFIIYNTSVVDNFSIWGELDNKLESTNVAAVTASSSNLCFPSWNEKGLIVGQYGQPWKDQIFQVNGGYQYILQKGSWTMPNMFVPTQGGTQGQVLQSNGNAAPTWINLIKPQRITQDAYDELETKDPNVLYIIVDE